MPTIVNVKNVQKTYEGGFNALKDERTVATRPFVACSGAAILGLAH
jgi:hypothetical protein